MILVSTFCEARVGQNYLLVRQVFEYLYWEKHISIVLCGPLGALLFSLSPELMGHLIEKIFQMTWAVLLHWAEDCEGLNSPVRVSLTRFSTSNPNEDGSFPSPHGTLGGNHHLSLA